MEFTKNKEAKEEITLKESVSYIFTYVKKYKMVKILMIMLFGLTLVYYPLTNLAIQNIMRIRVGATENQLSYVVAALGIGVIVGAIVGSTKKIENEIKKLSNKIFALAILVLAWVAPAMIYLTMDVSKKRTLVITAIFIVIMAALGAFYTQIVIPSYSYMQMYVDENVRGRVFGLATSALNIAGPVGLVLYGILFDMKIDIAIIVISALLLIGLGTYVARATFRCDSIQENI